MSNVKNWLNQGAPCAGDHIVFEVEKLTAAVLDRSLDISQIDLPDTGVLYFGDDVVLGESNQQQCQRRKSPEHTFYEPEEYYGSYYNPKNWILEEGERPFLHMKLVPSAYDDAIFGIDSIQFELEQQARVTSLYYGGQSRSIRSFVDTVNSIEGRYKVKLGHSLAKLWSIDGLEVVTPRVSPFLVEQKALTHLERSLGRRNPNMENKTMALICGYVPCVEPTDCVKTITPIGHCCPICGSVIQFSGYETILTKVQQDIQNFLDSNPQVKEKVNFEIDRVDDDLTPSDFQITLFKRNDKDEFAEEPFIEVIGFLEHRLHRHLNPTLEVTDFKVTLSRIDRTLQTSSIVIGTLLFLIILGTILIKFSLTDEIIRKRIGQLINNSASVQTIAVHFRSKGGDNDEIQLIDQRSPTEIPENLLSEEEDCDDIKAEITLLPVPDEDVNVGVSNPVFVETKSQVSSKVEEMSLIDL